MRTKEVRCIVFFVGQDGRLEEAAAALKSFEGHQQRQQRQQRLLLVVRNEAQLEAFERKAELQATVPVKSFDLSGRSAHALLKELAAATAWSQSAELNSLSLRWWLCFRAS